MDWCCGTLRDAGCRSGLCAGASGARRAPQAPTAPAPAARGAAVSRRYIRFHQHSAHCRGISGRKALAGRVQTLNQQKVNELNEKNKQLQAAQQKLEAGASVLSPVAAGQLQKRSSGCRSRSALYRGCAAGSDTAADTAAGGVPDEVVACRSAGGNEKGLHLLFSAADAGIVWADLSLDITGEIIQRFDAAAKTRARPHPNRLRLPLHRQRLLRPRQPRSLRLRLRPRSLRRRHQARESLNPEPARFGFTRLDTIRVLRCFGSWVLGFRFSGSLVQVLRFRFFSSLTLGFPVPGCARGSRSVC